jgi:hypothetical protein
VWLGRAHARIQAKAQLRPWRWPAAICVGSVTQRVGAVSGGDVASYAGFLVDEGEARVRAAYPGLDV